MASVNTIRTGLKTRLQTITGVGLTVFDYPPDQAVAPAAWVTPISGEYSVAMGSGILTELRFEITLVVSWAGGTQNAMELLDPYVDNTGTQSIRAAVATDPTLGGAAQFARVLRWRDYSDQSDAGIAALGAVFDVEVYAA